ncbi:alpha-protein kinase 2 isoform X4 [Kogia breviceps]|uniref:alpha-protein kinase 2 isoform X4 n=1 Tax=Kogia breviceps TaxID=27615 RepID=UPI0034D261A7
MRQTEEACGPDNTEDIAEGLLCSDSSTIPDKQDVCGHRTVHSKLSRLMDGALDTNGPNEGGLNSSHQNPKVQKYISLSLPLMEAASSTSPGDRATSKNPVSRPASRRGFDSDYELCSEISLTCTEEFSDNDLEYLECSDVMTDHSNAIWQRDLQGTERVFLLESDDEEMEFGECCPGGCENFLSEMGCEPLVADDTGPMDATAGLCGYRLPSQGGEVRSSLASVHSASSPQTGVTLPVGPHQDGTSVVTDKGRDKPPTAPEAAEDGYPGTQGETRDGHQAGKEFASDNLLNMDKAVTERERKHLYAPVLLKKIQAEMFPDHSGNVKLSCQFAEIHEDSTIWWMKDSKSIAQVQRRAGDGSAVSLAILQASQKDQGLYSCCIKNSFGKVATEFNLTTEVLKQLSSHPDVNVYEEIEFSQLIFRGDFLSDSYFGGRLRGQIATEELHFGEGVHRKAFRSKVMQGLTPVFKPGHACVLKVHNAVAYGTRNNDELIQRNYKLAAQECYVQNTARYYAKIYAAEAQPLEGFGEVPEIIPIFLIHRPENNIPYATVEEELIGEFVKYSIRDGKEINFLRRESEAGQKCCTFQHWVYQKTSGCLLVTDMQGVGMKLTDVGIATLAKGYKGFKGNCSMTFIDQFKALHQCNKYCKMLGLKSLQNNSQKQKKPSIGKSKIQPNCTTVKKMASGTPAEKKT